MIKIICPQGTLFELNEESIQNPNVALMMTRTNPSGIAFDALPRYRKNLKGSLLLLEDLTKDITEFGILHAFEYMKRIKTLATFNTNEFAIGFVDCKQLYIHCKGFNYDIKGISHY